MKTIDHLWEESELTIDELSARSGLSRERVLAIVDGRWTPSPQERESLAGVFQIPVAEISWGHSLSPRQLRYRRHGFQEDF
ncbi:MAG: helix-turn-helix transcriptional regulator [Pirellulales bacterium]